MSTRKSTVRVRYYATVQDDDGRFPVFEVVVIRNGARVTTIEHRNTPIATYPTFTRAIEHCGQANYAIQAEARIRELGVRS